jgi:hypothetical protein
VACSGTVLAYKTVKFTVVTIMISCMSWDCFYHTISRREGVRFLKVNPNSLAVPWFRQLVAGLSQWRPGFAPGSVHVGFVVD